MKDRVKWTRERSTMNMTSSVHFGMSWEIQEVGDGKLNLVETDVKTNTTKVVTTVKATKRNFKGLWNRVNKKVKSFVDIILERK